MNVSKSVETYFFAHYWLDAAAVRARNEELGTRVQVLDLVSLAEPRLAKLADGVVLETVLGVVLLLVLLHVAHAAPTAAVDHLVVALFRVHQIVLEDALPLAAVVLVAAVDLEIVDLFLKLVINEDLLTDDSSLTDPTRSAEPTGKEESDGRTDSTCHDSAATWDTDRIHRRR